MEEQIKIIQGFPEHLRQPAAEVYFEAFSQKIGWLLGGKTKAVAYITKVMDPKFAICAIDNEGGAEKLVGLAGFKTSQGCLVGGGFADLASSFGLFSSLWRAPLLMMLDRNVEPDVLLMDGIAVTLDQRGRGTGSKLLDAIANHAKTNGYHRVRLDVIDSNFHARKLYERKGFKAINTDDLGPFKHLFGFSSATEMVLEIS